MDAHTASDSSRVVLRVGVPADSSWHPPTALSLVRGWVPPPGLLALRLHAEAETVAWEVVTEAAQAPAVTRTILTVYPTAEVAAAPLYRLWRPVRVELSAAAPFYTPLCALADLGGADPLRPLLGALLDLEQGEQLVYQLKLLPTDASLYRTRAARLLGSVPTDPALRPTAADRALHQAASEKVGQPLAQARLSVVAASPTAGRAGVLLEGVLRSLRGFRADHPLANRLIRARRDGGELVLTSAEVAALWHLPDQAGLPPEIVRASGLATPLPPPLRRVRTGAYLGDHTYQGRVTPVYFDDPPDQTTHIHVIGQTGMGKTHTLDALAADKIARGEGVMVIDPKGDWVPLVLEGSIPPEREGQVVVLDVTDSVAPPALNLLAVPEGVPTRVGVNTAMKVMERLFGQSLTVPMRDALYHTLELLIAHPGGHLGQVERLYEDGAFRGRLLSVVAEGSLRRWWERFERMEEPARLYLIEPLLRRIRELTRNPAIARMVCQSRCVDLRALLEERLIALVRLPLEDVTLGQEAAVLGAALLSQLQLAAMSRGDVPRAERHRYTILADEVQHFTTSSLSTILAEARSFGLALVVAHQYLKQLEGDTLEAVLANAGATVMFNLSPPDARAIAPWLGGAIPAEALTRLDRHQAVVRMRQGTTTLAPFALTTRPPAEPAPDGLARRERIIERSRTLLRRRGWVAAPLPSDDPPPPQGRPERRYRDD